MKKNSTILWGWPLIEILDFLGIFGQVCGTWWIPSWKIVQPFIHKKMVKPKWSIEKSYIFFEDTAASILVSCGMNNFITFNMLTTMQNTPLHKHRHMRHVLDTFLDCHWISFLGRMLLLMAIAHRKSQEVHWKFPIDTSNSSRSTWKELRQVQRKAREA